jgi:uncharacterized protein (TIGR02231 family)
MLSPLVVAVLAASTVLAPASQSVGAAAAAASAGARDDTPEAETILATAPISEVTLYQGRAMISRTEKSPAREGLFEIRFERLPPALDASSLQATVRSDRGGAKLLDVRFEETVTQADVTNNPELKEAITRLETARRLGESLAMKLAAINDRYTLLNSIRQKTATESAKDFGSKDLDPEALGKQIAFLDSTQAQLIADRVDLDNAVRSNNDEINALSAKVNALGGQTKVERTAVVSVGQSIAQSADVTLRYLVGNAGWQPRYAVRADADGGTLVIEYDADIRQATGEDWTDVRLTLSTAQPTQKAAPSDVPPFFVDVFVPPPPGAPAVTGAPAMRRAPSGRPSGPGGGTGGSEGGAQYDLALAGAADAPMNAAYAASFADAYAVQSGTVVAYPLPRAIDIPSDAQRGRKQRIATIDATPTFVHVARPLVESAVYLKATAANASAYQFLAGPATVFLGGDSVGTTNLPDLAPGAEMTFWLGADRRIEVKRVIVKKSTSEKGVFEKSDETRWDYRVDLASTIAKPITVELVDRMPVSRNEQVKIELKDLSQPLVTDAKFVADEKPQGILKWLVQIPARAEAGKPATKSVSWSVVADKPKDVQITGLPD